MTRSQDVLFLFLVPTRHANPSDRRQPAHPSKIREAPVMSIQSWRAYACVTPVLVPVRYIQEEK